MIQGITNDVKLKKLKLAKKLALTNSQKKKVLKSANEFDNEIDNRIQSIALNKFVVRKTQKLKALGKTKEEIANVLSDLTINEKSFVERSISSLRGFGIDKKFKNMSAEQILKKVNAIPKEDADVNKPVENKPAKPKEPKSPKSPKKGLTIKVNPDTDTVSDTERNNEKIYDYLVKNGETDIAEYILDLMTSPSKGGYAKTSDIQTELDANTQEIKRLSMINSGIYEELEKLRKNQFEQQDTSIPVQEQIQREINQQTIQEMPQSVREGSFWNVIKTLGLGASLSYFAGLFDNDNFTKAIDFIKAGDFGGLVKHLGGLDWLNGVIKTAAIAILATALGPIKGSIKLLQVGMKSMEWVKAAVTKIISILPNIPQVGKYFKSLKSVDGKELKIGRAATDLPEKSVSSNLEKATKNADEIEKKSVKKLSASNVTKKAGKLASKLGKFTKFVPFLGLAIASGTAIYAATDGYNNADKILGIPPEQLTETHKIAAAAGAAISDFLWPLSPDAKTTADLVLKAAALMGIDTEPKQATIPSKTNSKMWMGKSFPNGSDDYGRFEYKRVDYTPPTPNKSVNVDNMKLGDLFTLNTPVDSVKNLNPDVLHNFKSMAAEYMDMFGEKIQINSGFRSFAEQAELKKKYGDKAAAPGSSMHNYGFAVDIQSDQAKKAVQAGLFDKYGFWRPVMPKETWHVEPVGIDRESIRVSGRQNWSPISTPKSMTMSEDENQDAIEFPTKSVNSEIDINQSQASLSSRPTSNNIQDLNRELSDLRKIKAQMIQAKGTQKGTEIYNQKYGQREREIQNKIAEINQQGKLPSPEVNKNKQIQNIENSQNALIKSTLGFQDRNMAQMQNMNKSLLINSINPQNPPRDNNVSILDAFGDL